MYKKLQKYLVLGILLGIVIIVGATYAWFTWRSSNTDIIATVDAVKILYKKGPDIIGTLEPTTSKEEGLVKEITVSIDKTGDKVPTINFYLDIVTLENGLKDVSFKWEFYKNGTLLNSNNFSSVNAGNTLNLTENQTVSTSEDIYKLYIWIDGNMNNPGTMIGKSFSFSLWAKGYNTIYEEVPSTPEACFAFNSTTNTITRYYNNEGDNASNPLCPKDVVIPKQVNSVDVLHLASGTSTTGVFVDKNITSVILQNGLKTIGNYAFYQNKLSGTLIIPKTVTSIGIQAFYGSHLEPWTNQLTSVIFESESQLQTISGGAFQHNKLTGTIIIPKTVTYIGSYAFMGWSTNQTNQIESLIFESGSQLQTLEISAFANNKLSSVIIPSTVTTIGTNAFNQYNNLLTKVTNTTSRTFTWCDSSTGIIATSNCSPTGAFETTTLTITGTYARTVNITSS